MYADNALVTKVISALNNDIKIVATLFYKKFQKKSIYMVKIGKK